MKKVFAQIFNTFLVLLITYSSFFGVSTVAVSSVLFCSSSEASTAGLISSILFFYAAASASNSTSMLSSAATAFPATDILRGLSSLLSLIGADSSDIDIRVLWMLDCTGFLFYSLMAWERVRGLPASIDEPLATETLVSITIWLNDLLRT